MTTPDREQALGGWQTVAFRSAWSLSGAQWDKILSAALARVQARIKAKPMKAREVWKVPCDHCQRMTRVPPAPDTVSTKAGE